MYQNVKTNQLAININILKSSSFGKKDYFNINAEWKYNVLNTVVILSYIQFLFFCFNYPINNI